MQVQRTLRHFILAPSEKDAARAGAAQAVA